MARSSGRRHKLPVPRWSRPSGEQQVLAVGRGLMAEGMTMLLVEQNVHMALAVSDYAYVLAEGKIWMEGKARPLAKRAEVRQAHLGI